MRLGALLIAVVALVPGCYRLGMIPPPCPAEGGPAWHRYTTEHFELETDVDEAEGRNVAIELETLRSAILRSAWGDAPGPPRRFRVVLLYSQGEMERYQPPRWFGQMKTMMLGRYVPHRMGPFVLSYAGARDEMRRVVVHELSHFVSHYYLPALPRWMDEGFATYFESVEVSPNGVTIGRPSRMDDFFSMNGRPSIQGIVNWSPLQVLNPRGFYGGASVLVFYLLNARPKEFVAYQEYLRSGRSAPDAWDKAFHGRSPSDLEPDLLAYVRGGHYTVRTLPLPEVAAPSTTTLSDAEVHVLRSVLFSVDPTPDRLREMRREADEALRQDSHNGNALALEISNAADAAEQKRLAERAVDLAPDNGWVWFAKGSLPSESPSDVERSVAALKRASVLLPDSATILTALGAALRRGSRFAEALATLDHAVALEPGAMAAHEERGKVLGVLHRCPDAVRELDLALQLAPEGLPGKQTVSDLKAARDGIVLDCSDRGRVAQEPIIATTNLAMVRIDLARFERCASSQTAMRELAQDCLVMELDIVPTVDVAPQDSLTVSEIRDVRIEGRSYAERTSAELNRTFEPVTEINNLDRRAGQGLSEARKFKGVTLRVFLWGARLPDAGSCAIEFEVGWDLHTVKALIQAPMERLARARP